MPRVFLGVCRQTLKFEPTKASCERQMQKQMPEGQQEKNMSWDGEYKNECCTKMSLLYMNHY